MNQTPTFRKLLHPKSPSILRNLGNLGILGNLGSLENIRGFGLLKNNLQSARGLKMISPSIALGPLEAVSTAFENKNPYLTNGIFVDLKKLEDLGFAHLNDHLQKYMGWLGISNEYNVQVLRVFYDSLSAKAKYKKIDKNMSAIGRVDFKATVRGRTIKFNWRDINRFLGVTDEEMNEWTFPEKLEQTELVEAYGTEGKKVSGMPDTQRVLQYIYSRIMANKRGNFNEFTQLDNPWLAKFLTKKPINPGQLISMELHRWVEGKKKGPLPYPQFIAFLLEQFNIKSTEEVDNKRCLPMGSMNLGKMGVRYLKPAKPTQSGSQLEVLLTTPFPLHLEQGIKRLTLKLVPATLVLQECLLLKRHLQKN